jgi:hypothetical protein
MNEQEFLRYTFAKWCWKRREEQAPNKEAGRFWTWEEIFFRRHKIKLADYAADRPAGRSAGGESEGASAPIRPRS